jgi:hypothetical protein
MAANGPVVVTTTPTLSVLAPEVLLDEVPADEEEHAARDPARARHAASPATFC